MRALVDTNVLVYASLDPLGAVAFYLHKHTPFVTDVSEIETLTNWKDVNNPAFVYQKIYLETYFDIARLNERYIKSLYSSQIEAFAAEFQTAYGFKTADALIAAAAYTYYCTLITANTRDFTPSKNQRLFHEYGLNVLTFNPAPDNRETFFQNLG